MAPHAEDTTSFTIPVSKTKSPPEVQGMSDTSGVVVLDPVMHVSPTRPKFRHQDVLPQRAASKTTMAKGVAPFSNAEMFKSEAALAKPKASRSFYETHLTQEAKARKSSSLKGAMKFFKPETISLCGGLPSSEYFPFEELAFESCQSPSFVPSQTGIARARKHDVAQGVSQFDLSIALNYGQSMGPPQLMRYLTEHTEIVHSPPYRDWEICLTQGSTSALDICLRMFCNRGDALLTEEYSFSSAIETALPMGLVPVGVKMDAKGLCPKDLEHIMSNWDEGDRLGQNKYRGASRPRVLYTVPTGQNPTGATQDEQRRRDILKICEQYGVFILEDEPYYFLQMNEYVSKMQNGHSNGHSNGDSKGNTNSTEDDLGTFIDALVPSYLTLSSTGNVMRMDSFSKIIAPGSRTGWVTGPADIIERFVRASEVSAQNPSGFSMMVLYKLLEEQWGHEGFLRWLMNLRLEYSQRRDGIVSACEQHLPRDIVQFDAPAAGMFHWLRVDAAKHPRWQIRAADVKTEAQKQALMIELEEDIFAKAAENNVLIARGSWFRAEKDNGSGVAQQGTVNLNDAIVYFRMTFAAAPQDKIEEAVRRFGETLNNEFKA